MSFSILRAATPPPAPLAPAPADILGPAPSLREMAAAAAEPTIVNGKPTTDHLKGLVPLTAPGQPLDQGPELRKIAALYRDGTLLVCSTYRDDAQVDTLIGTALNCGIRLKSPYHYVSMGEIAQLYQLDDLGPATPAGRTAAAATERADQRIQRRIHQIVLDAIRANASDIHLTVDARSAGYRFRVHGDLEHAGDLTIEEGHAICSSLFMMADSSDANYRPYEPQGARLGAETPKGGWLPAGTEGLRIQWMPLVNNGTKITIRIHRPPNIGADETFLSLGYSPEHAEALDRCARRSSGVTLISGPTGHGKSRLLSVCVRRVVEITGGKRSYQTLEDPAEAAIHPLVHQSDIKNAQKQEERDEKFIAAMNALLRMDPDHLMIQEIRDTPTGVLVFRAAMTGHQCWTTLHTTNAGLIPFRLKDIGVPSFMIESPEMISGLVGQRLVPLLCPDCKIPFEPGSALDQALDRRLSKKHPRGREGIYMRGPGCSRCNHRQTIGRTVAAEVIVPDRTYLQLVKNNAAAEAADYWIEALGGRSMLRHGMEKMYAGLVAPHDVEQIGLLDDCEHAFT